MLTGPFVPRRRLRFLKVMIHVIYLSTIGIGALILLFGGREYCKLRRAFLAACNREGVEIAARQQAAIRIAKDTQALAGARLREMRHLAEIESQGAQLNRAEATIRSLYAKLKEIEFDDAPLPASSKQPVVGQQTNDQVRVTGALVLAHQFGACGQAPIFSGRTP